MVKAVPARPRQRIREDLAAEPAATTEPSAELNVEPTADLTVNRHDARAAEEEECDAIRVEINRRGYEVNTDDLVSRAERFTAIHLLVTHGLVTEHEVNAAFFGRLRALLRDALRQVDEAELAKKQSPLVVPAGPKLAIARH